MIRISMLGTGYVGLVTGACLADLGNLVTCADIDSHKIRLLQSGGLPFYEPGLAELIQRNCENGRLSFELDLGRAVAQAQVVFLAVGTPPRPDGSADLSALFAAAQIIAENHHKGYTLVVQKSTAPVGTARRLGEEIVARNGNGGRVDVASNPEFLREGTAIQDFLQPDRVVIGTQTTRAEQLLRKIYLPLCLRGTPVLTTNLETAEMIKYASNCFLATKISYINEIANLCEHVGADVQIVARGMGMDRRIGPKFLHAGPGFGGSCFPKDAQALVHFATSQGDRLRIAEAALDVNRVQRQRMLDKTSGALGGLHGKRIALLGLAFKPDTDDVRESAGLDLAGRFLLEGAIVDAHDPAAMENARTTPVGQKLAYAADPYVAVEGADAVVVATDWDQYRKLDLKRVATLLRRPVLIDLRDIYEPQDAARAGLDYYCVGRPPVLASRSAETPAPAPPVREEVASALEERAPVRAPAGAQ